MIRKEYTGGRYVTYTYNAEGQLAKLTYGDGANEKASYLFEYDSLGRLVRSSEADGSGTITQRTEHIYDEYSRLKRQSWTLGSKSYSEAYTYNDGEDQTGNLSTMTTGTGNVLNYTYDPLKRLQKVTVKSGTTSLFSTAYAYRNIDSTRTTQQVEFRNVRLESDNSILEGKKYVYDSLGNITEIRQSTSPYNLLIAYEYDAQNQLTSEVHYDGNGAATANITVAYYYDYDAAGNILKVEKGTVNSAGTLTKTTEQTYTYNDTDWHDLLTELNDTPIVYEGQTYDPETNEVGGSILSGNPKYYNGWNFDWQRGRELASAEQTDGTTNTTLTYAYDADGIRTSKTYTVKTYETRYTVTFVADGTTVKTMTVADGYTLKDSDYPTVPAKSGYTGSWNKYTEAIHASITIEAVYQEITDCTVRFVAERIILKTMTVKVGYTLKDFDYPTIPQKAGYTAAWSPHSRKIIKNTIITVKYTKNGGGGGGITIPTVRPTYSDAISDLPEPIEPQDVAKTAEAQAAQSGQVLVSTQTVTHEYMTLSGKVARETVKENGTVTDVMDFVYDESGRPFAMIHQAGSAGISLTTYYYVLNLQGDVVKLVNASGTVVASYEYDAWGNILSKSGAMADKNPLRYRGYYYDAETGYYYLQSRYYDPTVRRFINADSYASTGQGFVGTNMFTYCNNNPVIYADTTGHALDPRLRTTAVCDNGRQLIVTFYNSELETVSAFASKYFWQTKRYSVERAALVYETTYAGKTLYYCGVTVIGGNDDVWFPPEGYGVDEKLATTSVPVAVVHMHPDMDHVDSTRFSPEDIGAWELDLPDGNMYLATLQREIYMFDRVKKGREGIFMGTYSPDALRGSYSTAKRLIDYLL